MDLERLMRILKELTEAGNWPVERITIKGTREYVLSCSIPDGPVPLGWERTVQPKVQREPGWQRIVFRG